MLRAPYYMNNAASQQFIEIAGIKEGIIINTNGGYRIILDVGVTNFSLKSEEEQNSIIFKYQGFLNSLHFPIEIVMRSKRLDLNPYIKKLTVLKEKQDNDLLQMQMEDYINFIGELVNMANIMKKKFYVIVSYDPVEIKKPSILGALFSKKDQNGMVRIPEATFKHHKDQLVERANTVANGLGSLGLQCVQLTTEQIIELFYGIYNPEVADLERFSDVESLTSSVVDEKKADKTKDATSETTAEATSEETVIDNSNLVESQQKEDMKARQIAADKEAEKGGTPEATPKEETKTEPAPASTPPPPPANTPVPLPTSVAPTPAVPPPPTAPVPPDSSLQ